MTKQNFRLGLKLWLFMALFIGAFGIVNKAKAACSNPAGDAGKQVYNSSFGIMQFCNGTNWISMAGGSPTGGGGSDNLGNHAATTALDLATNKIVNLGAPTAGTDAATKAYVDTEIGGITDSDILSALSCSNNEVARYDGSDWVCANVASSDTLNGLSCSSGQVAEWDGSNWVCASVASSDTLNTLSCTSGQVAEWDGSAWVCADNGSGGGGSCTASSWTARTPAESNLYTDVVYAEGKFVAVGIVDSGTNPVMTSNDGISWVAQSAPIADWFSLAYGNDTFVAVGDNGNVMSSPDGETWTARTAPEANNWSYVTYGNGIFVAVSTTGTNRVMTSPDGITWTGQTAAEANPWSSVTYGSGIFVAVSTAGTNRVMTSPDGITWTSQTAAEANTWMSVTYGNNTFVAVSQDGTNRVMTSPNGVTWTARSAPPRSWLRISYAGNKFVGTEVDPGGGPISQYVMTSDDGISWTEQTVTSSLYYLGATYGDEKLVIVGSSVITSGCSAGGGGVGGSSAWGDLTGVPAGFADDTDDDTLAGLSCSSNEVAQYDGSDWICANVASSDTLNTLSCSSGQVAEWNGSAWVCATASGSDDLGDHTATQDLDMATFKVDNTGSVIYDGSAGDEPVGTSFLSQLSCASGQVAQFDGSTWVCSTVTGGGGGADNLGSHIATQDLNMGTFSVTNSDSVVYNGKVGDEPVLVNPDTLDDLSCTSGQIAKYDGTDWACAADIDTDTNTDTLSALSCSSGEVAKWNGSAWACSTDIDTDTDTNTDTLSTLSCSSGEVAKWNGSTWACSTDIDTDTNDDLGNHTATQALNFANFKATNTGGVIFTGTAGNAPTK